MPMLIGRRELTTAFCGVALWPLSARAQEGGKKYTIAMFGAGNQHAVPALNATFFGALKELGWVEGTAETSSGSTSQQARQRSGLRVR